MRANNLFFICLFSLIYIATNNLLITPPQSTSPYITLTTIQRDIDNFLRGGYRQLTSGMLVNIKAEGPNNLLAYLVPNGSVFVFNTQYVSQNHSVKILGVLQLTGLESQLASGIRISTTRPPTNNNSSGLISDRRMLSAEPVSNIVNAQTKTTIAPPQRKRTFLEQLGNFDFTNEPETQTAQR